MHTRRTAAPRSLEPETQTAVGRPATAAPASDTTTPGASADALIRKLQQRAKAPTMPPGAAGRFRMDATSPARADRQSPEPVFRSSQEAASQASRPGERAVRIRSAEAPQRARQLVRLSKGRPLYSDVAASLRGRFGAVVDDVTVHEDERAGLATQLLGAHAFSLGHRVFLGATLNTPDGPSRLDALRHEVTHIAQSETGARTGMGVGLLGAGGVRGLDYLSTRGAVASDILVGEAISGQVPPDAAAAEAAFGAAPWWGRASHGYLASRNMDIVYRGQGAIGEQTLSPLARVQRGLGRRDEALANTREAHEGLKDSGHPNLLADARDLVQELSHDGVS